MEVAAMFLDACAIIYLLECHDQKGDTVRQWVNDYLAVDGRHLLVSSLSILECLSFPKKHANHRLISEYETFFATDQVSIIDISRNIVYLVVELRAKYALRTPDALQLACALQQQATFVTGDKELLKVTEVSVMIL
jgi:predicted nucleic acid-binding protein